MIDKTTYTNGPNLVFFSSDPQDSVGRPKKTFRSEGRENALKLCGWGVPDVEPGTISPKIAVFIFK